MDKNSAEKSVRIRWSELNDSFSSTEAGYDASSLKPTESEHPETTILLDLVRKRKAPVSIYLNNLPYDIEGPSEIIAFLGFSSSDTVRADLITKEGKPSGRGVVTASSIEDAIQIVQKHGFLLRGRSVFMCLDCYFGRGKQFFRQLQPRKFIPKKPKGTKRSRYDGKKEDAKSKIQHPERPMNHNKFRRNLINNSSN